MDKRKKGARAASLVVDAAEITIGAVLRLVIRAVMTAVLVFLASGLLFGCIFAYYVKTSLSADLEVTLEEVSVSLSSKILYTDANGQSHELVTLKGGEERLWVEVDRIPEDMKNALVAIEDKRFYKHKGVDWYRTVGAFGTMFLRDSSSFGGSTITQQLIKNSTHNDDVTVQRKLLEIFQALELEKNYTKDQILEWYLNIVNFGGRVHGVQTAAQTYFGKDVEDLSLAECASIVGITNNPSKYNPFGSAMITDRETGIAYSNREWNKKRQELILYQMYDQGYIDYNTYQDAVNEELKFVRAENEEAEPIIYTYYEELVINDVLQDLMKNKNVNLEMARRLLYNGGYQIYCCLDPAIQQAVDDVYTNPSRLPQRTVWNTQQPLQSAIVVMEPYTGKILAISGGVGEKTGSFELNRATGSQRPSGSSIKPLSAYGPAMEFGLITQNTLVSDVPGIKLQGRKDGWFPANDGGYSGTITIRTALQYSKNTVAAQIIDKLTPEVSFQFLTERLGFTSLVDSDCDYAPLALGEFTFGVTVREMAQAYCSFVNDGVFTYSRSYTLVTDSDGNVVLDNQPRTIQAFSANTAANMCDMLKNAVKNGTGTDAYFSGVDVAGKTGTTSNQRDRYFCGFTPYYVAAVWTGYDTPVRMYYTGNPAAQIWKSVMQTIHAGLADKSFPVPNIGTATSTFGIYSMPQQPAVVSTPAPTPAIEVDVADPLTITDVPPSSGATSEPSGGSTGTVPSTGVDPGASTEPGTGTDPSTHVDPSTGVDPGTGTGSDPGGGVDPGAGADPGGTVDPGSGADPGGSLDPVIPVDPGSGATGTDTGGMGGFESVTIPEE